MGLGWQLEGKRKLDRKKEKRREERKGKLRNVWGGSVGIL